MRSTYYFYSRQVLSKTIICSDPVLLGIYPKELKSEIQRDMCTHTSEQHIHNSRKVEATQWPLMDEWLKKMWLIRIVEYYSALNRKEIL